MTDKKQRSSQNLRNNAKKRQTQIDVETKKPFDITKTQ
jgi:hypothetical protein